MNLSPSGIALIKSFEGCSLTAYWDVKGFSIGWGHFGATEHQQISQEEADALFLQDIKEYEEAVNSSVTVSLTQDQFDALVSLTYNIGVQAFKNSTLLKKLNEGDYGAAAAQFDVWNKAGGAENAVLTRRRSKERQLFESAVRSTVGATVAVPEQVTESAQPPPLPRVEGSGGGRDTRTIHVGGEGELQEAQMPDPVNPDNNPINVAANVASVINPPLGALLQVASALFPKVATLVLDKDKSVPQRNVAIGAAVLDTIAQATGSSNRIDGLAKVANDPVARAAAEQALNPYMVMVDAGAGTVEARKALLTAPMTNKFEAIRAIGYGFMVAVIALILIIGGGYMLYMVLMDPKTAEQTKGLIIGFICGTAMAAPILFFFGSSGSSKGKDATIQSLSQSR